MRARSLYLLLILLILPMVVVSCDREEASKKEKEKETVDFNEKENLKPKEPKRTVFVYINPSSGSVEGNAKRVYVPVGTDSSQTIAIGSASFYNWVEDVKKRFAREKLESANEDCVLMEKIARNNSEHLDINAKVDMKCVEINTEEPSHTDPSPIDGVDEWVVCQPTDSGPGSSGPGGNPGGGPGAGPGSGPGDPGIGTGGDSGEDAGSDDTGSGSDTVDAMVEILCTPAVRVNPGVDPRLIYPAPDQVEAIVVNIAPCVDDFCPFEIVFDVPELEDPTDPIDPSQDEPEELTEDIKGQLMCDQFRGLCETDITLISKGDLAKDTDDSKCDEGEQVCDGVCTDKSGNQEDGEICNTGIVGSEDSEWIDCVETKVTEGSVCVKHEINNDGDSAYTISYGRGVPGDVPSNEERIKRGQDAKEIADFYSSGTCSEVNPVRPTDNTTTYRVTCDRGS